MKLSQKQKDELQQMWGDWESTHGFRDDLILRRLRELDHEFIEDIEKAFEKAYFWYA